MAQSRTRQTIALAILQELRTASYDLKQLARTAPTATEGEELESYAETTIHLLDAIEATFRRNNELRPLAGLTSEQIRGIILNENIVPFPSILFSDAARDI